MAREDISVDSKQFKLLQENPNTLMKITENGQGGEGLTVLAPLPETFGFTVGSEFSAPFDAGISSGLLQKAIFVAGLSQKLGMRMKKMYANPEPVEMSYELEFTAYYNAYHEVVEPVLKLLIMSLGRSIDWDKMDERTKQIKVWLEQKLGEFTERPETSSEEDPSESAGNLPQVPQVNGLSGVSDFVPTTQEEWNGMIKRVGDFIGIIEGPNTQSVSFGNLMSIDNVFITSVAPQFSNVLDANGVPVHCTCSITMTLENYPIADDILTWFDKRFKIQRGGGVE